MTVDKHTSTDDNEQFDSHTNRVCRNALNYNNETKVMRKISKKQREHDKGQP